MRCPKKRSTPRLSTSTDLLPKSALQTSSFCSLQARRFAQVRPVAPIPTFCGTHRKYWIPVSYRITAATREVFATVIGNIVLLFRRCSLKICSLRTPERPVRKLYVALNLQFIFAEEIAVVISVNSFRHWKSKLVFRK